MKHVKDSLSGIHCQREQDGKKTLGITSTKSGENGKHRKRKGGTKNILEVEEMSRRHDDGISIGVEKIKMKLL